MRSGAALSLLRRQAHTLNAAPAQTYRGPCLIPFLDFELELSTGSKLFLVNEPLDMGSAQLLDSTIIDPQTTGTASGGRRRSSLIAPSPGGGVRHAALPGRLPRLGLRPPSPAAARARQRSVSKGPRSHAP